MIITPKVFLLLLLLLLLYFLASKEMCWPFPNFSLHDYLWVISFGTRLTHTASTLITLSPIPVLLITQIPLTYTINKFYVYHR